jgi:hypothetical protein
MSARNRSRRDFLRTLGVGAAATAALPLLHQTATLAETPRLPKRLIVMAWPNGTMPDHWWPTGGERDFVIDDREDSPLKPLIPFRDRLLLMGGIAFQNHKDDGEGGGHAALPYMFTGVRGAPIDGAISDGVGKSAGGPSVDWYLAERIAETESLAVPHLATRMIPREGGPDWWSSFRGTPIDGQPNNAPTEHDPYRLYDTLFGSFGGGDSRPDPALVRARRERRSVLDFLGRSYRRAAMDVGAADRPRIEQHWEAIREVERLLDGESVTVPGCTAPTEPTAGLDVTTTKANRDIPQILRAQMDLTVMAMACDLTRVSSLLLGNSHNGQVTYFWLGDEFTDPSNAPDNAGYGSAYLHHHAISHHGFRSESHARRKNLVDQWAMAQLAYLLGKLDSIPEGDGTMLDNTLVLFGNNMRTGAGHGLDDLAWILAGNADGYFETGRMLRWISGREGSHLPQNRILTEICNAMGFPTDGFGDPAYAGTLDALRA